MLHTRRKITGGIQTSSLAYSTLLYPEHACPCILVFWVDVVPLYAYIGDEVMYDVVGIFSYIGWPCTSDYAERAPLTLWYSTFCDGTNCCSIVVDPMVVGDKFSIRERTLHVRQVKQRSPSPLALALALLSSSTLAPANTKPIGHMRRFSANQGCSCSSGDDVVHPPPLGPGWNPAGRVVLEASGGRISRRRREGGRRRRRQLQWQG